MSTFQANYSDWWLRYLLWNCPQKNVTRPYWWYVNIGSGNGLVPPGNKPLPEPILTQFSVTNAKLLSIGPLGTNFSEILIKLRNFSFTKMHVKISSAKWQPFCPRGDELIIPLWQLSQIGGCWWAGTYLVPRYLQLPWWHVTAAGLILGLRPTNERGCYFVTTSLIGWAQA